MRVDWRPRRISVWQRQRVFSRRVLRAAKTVVPAGKNEWIGRNASPLPRLPLPQQQKGRGQPGLHAIRLGSGISHRRFAYPL
jgi:hypothetical protein